MNALLNTAFDHAWGQIATLNGLETPDDAVGRSFTITTVNPDSVKIATAADSPLTIQRAAFIETLRYLDTHQHNESNPCEIRSNQVAADAGPLCRAARAANNNTRVINYIVPILVAVGLLGLSGKRPNSTWLA